VADLSAAMDTAFEEVRAEPASEPAPAEPTASPEPEAEEAAQPAPAAPQDDEPTGDVLLDKLTPDQIAELKKDPRLRSIYKGLMSSYTPKMQQFAEQSRLWEALNNEGTRRQAVESLARAVGLDIKPTDQPQREQAAAVADGISDEWSKVVGPEAGAMLRPLIEKTALAAVQGTLEPMQKAADYVFMDARGRQAEAQVTQFRSLAKEKGWELTPDTEAKMAQLGQRMRPSKPIESVEEGVEYMQALYKASTGDDVEARIEKRILERMNKAAQSAEPARGVPSTGREKRTNITKEMNLNEAMDVAFQELGLNR
jgi:hypothetical protein